VGSQYEGELAWIPALATWSPAASGGPRRRIASHRLSRLNTGSAECARALPSRCRASRCPDESYLAAACSRSLDGDLPLACRPCHRLRRYLRRRTLSRPSVTSARSRDKEPRHPLSRTSHTTRPPLGISLLSDVGMAGSFAVSPGVPRLSVCKLILDLKWNVFFSRAVMLAIERSLTQ